MLQSVYMIRRLKKDVLDQLPDKRRQMITVDIDSKSMNEISGARGQLPVDALSTMFERDAKKSFNDYFDSLVEQTDTSTDQSTGIDDLMSAYRLTGQAKVKGVSEFLETLYENGAKFLVFAHHKSVLDEYEKFL